MRKIVFSLFLCLLAVGATVAQDSCPTIVQQALDAVDQFCEGAGRNQACFGNVALTATPKEGVSNFQFQQTGDIIEVNDIASMELQPMDETSGTWGVVLMRLQANLPDTAPGQNVTFLLFGDVAIEPNLTAETEAPMQAFYLKTGIGDAPCAEAPSSGVIVQTPEGAEQVAFNINGVDVQMGSTLLFRADPGEEMTVSSLEGAGTVELDGELFPIVEGTWARMPMDEDFNLTDAPEFPTAYKKEVLDALPIGVLDRQIEVRTPLNEEELAKLHELLANGQAPCGDAEGIFPACDHLPQFSADDPNAPRWASGDQWGAKLPEVLNNIPSIVTLDDGSQCSLKPVFLQERTENSLPPCAQVIPQGDLQGKIQEFRQALEQLPTLTTPDGTECVIRAFADAPADATRPFCDEVLSPEDLQSRIQELGGKFPNLGDKPFGNNGNLPDLPCVMQPGPNDPPLPDTETRPFCDPVTPQTNGQTDTRPCVMQPGPNDPPLPSTETRPFCDTSGNQPPADGNQPPADGSQPPTDGSQPPTDGSQPPADDNNPPPPPNGG